jgi:hypothetical protein
MNKLLKIILTITIVSTLFCSCKTECYHIRKWETTINYVDEFSYIDTLELSSNPLSINSLDSIIEISDTNEIKFCNSIFHIEAVHTIKWRSDSMKVFRLLKDGNLTIYYTKPFGIIFYSSKTERNELKEIKNSCTKQIIIMDDFIQQIKNDTILSLIHSVNF